jgi:hypothetical protein
MRIAQGLTELPVVSSKWFAHAYTSKLHALHEAAITMIIYARADYLYVRVVLRTLSS